MIIYTMLWYMIVATITAVAATDYCSENICGKGAKHIACGHSGQFNSSCPVDARIVEITDYLKKVLVDAHNAKRNIIAGSGDIHHDPACRMATMEWDDDLAALAALNVRQCKMAYDECHSTDTFNYAGQNLAQMAFYGAVNNAEKLIEAVEIWYSEVENSRQTYIDCYSKDYSGPVIGHFTVTMVDRNNRVGCAASTYTPEGEFYKEYLVACNYATNNMIDFPIYVKCNKAGISCTTGTNRHYPNLCSTLEQYDVNKWP